MILQFLENTEREVPDILPLIALMSEISENIVSECSRIL